MRGNFGNQPPVTTFGVPSGVPVRHLMAHVYEIIEAQGGRIGTEISRRVDYFNFVPFGWKGP